MNALKVFAVLASIGFVVGCSSSEDEESLPKVDCMGSIPKYTEVTAFQKCSTCHSSKLSGTARKEAPEDINFDTLAGADAHAEKAASEVNSDAMPPKASGLTLSDAERQQLYKWSLCGTMQ